MQGHTGKALGRRGPWGDCAGKVGVLPETRSISQVPEGTGTLDTESVRRLTRHGLGAVGPTCAWALLGVVGGLRRPEQGLAEAWSSEDPRLADL